MYNTNWNGGSDESTHNIAAFTSTLEKMGYIIQEDQSQYISVKIGSNERTL